MEEIKVEIAGGKKCASVVDEIENTLS